MRISGRLCLRDREDAEADPAQCPASRSLLDRRLEEPLHCAGLPPGRGLTCRDCAPGGWLWRPEPAAYGHS